MFHMSREIYDKALELADLIKQSKEYNKYKEAESAGENDSVLSACEQAYAHICRTIECETEKDIHNAELLSALSHDMDETIAQIQSLPVFQVREKARNELYTLLQGVNELIRGSVIPDVSCSCGGTCSGCSGCGNQI